MSNDISNETRGEIEKFMSQIDSLISAINDRLTGLEMRISPILNQQNQQGGEAQLADKPDTKSEFGALLVENINRLETINDALITLIDAVEL